MVVDDGGLFFLFLHFKKKAGVWFLFKITALLLLQEGKAF